ncbi:MAG TPA: DEAD/DEAH box helicase [Verrucomicrobiales bacterium]|nr:DEAD/DEAH box helicase [Verrucomicrobiales bacterium]
MSPTAVLPLLALSPEGVLKWHVESTEPETAELPASVLRALSAAFESSAATGLLDLAALPGREALPDSLHYWRGFAQEYLTRLCHIPRLREDGWQGGPPVPEDAALDALITAAPPLPGMEFLTSQVLAGLWLALNAEMSGRIAAHGGDAVAALGEINKSWRLVGRVTLHLAENKRSPEFPFAFLATYSHRMDAHGKVQHLPLAQALRDSAAEGNKELLQTLLAPLHEASGASALLREMIESRRIFQPLAWTPEEAWQFLREIPKLEDSGLIVRVPDWWKSGRSASRPAVTVTVESGEQRKGIGVEALLKFSVDVAMGGEILTPEELARILASEAPLISLKGQWVEIDRDKLKEALDKWKQAAAASMNGIPFHVGLRMLAGMPGAAAEAEELTASGEWTAFAAGDKLKELLAKLRDPGRFLNEKANVPGLHGTLRHYQRTGVNWMHFLSGMGLGACLADDMGLGKTIQVISLLLIRRAARKEPRPSLLVVPASLLGNWRRELEKFAPDMEYVIAHRSAQDAAAMNQFQKATHAALKRNAVVITTYTMLGKLEGLNAIDWDLAALDEAQAIKNAGTGQARAVKKLRASFRLALTGTPVENRLADLWSLFDYINPGLLGSPQAFAQTTARMAKSPRGFAPLRQLVQPYILRRMKTDPGVAPDLPDKTEVTAFCHLSKRQASLYQRAVTAMAKELASAEDGIQRQGVVLASLMRLKQICNHPSQFSGDANYVPEESGKFERLRELALHIADRQEKVLIFTQFKEMTAPLAGYLATVFGQSGLILHGGTAVARRSELVARFQEPGGPSFFVISVKAGGTGLTLTAASHVIHFDRWWNPAVEDQATDRAFRIGQTKNVLVHKFVCEGTLEERIDALISEKKALASDILGGDESTARVLTEMSDSDLLKFVRLDLESAC